MAAEGDVLDGQQQFLEDLHEGGEVLVDFALVAVLAVSECLVFLLIYHSIYYYWEGVADASRALRWVVIEIEYL